MPIAHDQTRRRSRGDLDQNAADLARLDEHVVRPFQARSRRPGRSCCSASQTASPAVSEMRGQVTASMPVGSREDEREGQSARCRPPLIGTPAPSGRLQRRPALAPGVRAAGSSANAQCPRIGRGNLPVMLASCARTSPAEPAPDPLRQSRTRRISDSRIRTPCRCLPACHVSAGLDNEYPRFTQRVNNTARECPHDGCRRRLSPRFPVARQQLAMTVALVLPDRVDRGLLRAAGTFSVGRPAGRPTPWARRCSSCSRWCGSSSCCANAVSWQWLEKRGLGIGLAFGAAVLIAMLGLYAYWLKCTALSGRVRAAGHGESARPGTGSTVEVRRPGRVLCAVPLVARGILLAVVRVWPVGESHCSLARRWSCPSLGFMAHHVVLLATFFGWDSPLAYLFSLAIAVGGAFWAWLYA